MDPTTLLTALFSYVVQMLPAQYAVDAASLWLVLVGLCAMAARHWARPKDGSRALWIYNLVNAIAQNRGNAANADDIAAKLTTPKN